MKEIESLILPLGLVAGGILLGMIFEKIVLARMRKIARRTAWRSDDIILASLRGTAFWAFIIAGVYAASLHVSMPENYLSIVRKALLVIAILLVTRAAARLSVGLIDVYTSKMKDILPSSTIFTNIARLLVYLIGVLIMLQSLGISIAPILTALGVGGLAVALALQDTLSNLFSGLYISISGQIKPGDYVRLDTGEEGHVTDITWRNTIIRELPNNRIIVPNSKLSTASIRNYHLPETEMAVLVQAGVSYDSDLEKVERITIEVSKDIMREVAGGIPDFEPFIRYHTFADFSINFTVILRCREFVDQYMIKHEFVKRLHRRYNEEGIEIPFPIRTVFLRGKGDTA